MTLEDLAAMLARIEALVWWGFVAVMLAHVVVVGVAVMVSQRGYRRRARIETAEIKQKVHDESGWVRDEAHGAHVSAIHAAQAVERLTKRQGSDPGRRE